MRQLPPQAASLVPQFPHYHHFPETGGCVRARGRIQGWGVGIGHLIPPSCPDHIAGPDQPLTPGVTRGHAAALLQ